jgi:hypothetical protein
MTREEELEMLVASGFTRKGAEEHLAERDAIAARVRSERDEGVDDSIDV